MVTSSRELLQLDGLTMQRVSVLTINAFEGLTEITPGFVGGNLTCKKWI
jgi:hypothetical protein